MLGSLRTQHENIGMKEKKNRWDPMLIIRNEISSVNQIYNVLDMNALIRGAN